mgnify:CR=1 FL=1
MAGAARPPGQRTNAPLRRRFRVRAWARKLIVASNANTTRVRALIGIIPFGACMPNSSDRPDTLKYAPATAEETIVSQLPR